MNTTIAQLSQWFRVATLAAAVITTLLWYVRETHAVVVNMAEIEMNMMHYMLWFSIVCMLSSYFVTGSDNDDEKTYWVEVFKGILFLYGLISAVCIWAAGEYATAYLYWLNWVMYVVFTLPLMYVVLYKIGIIRFVGMLLLTILILAIGQQVMGNSDN